MQNWVVRIQGRLISSATEGFAKNYRSIMEGSYEKELLAETDGELMADALGDIAYRYAFVSRPILRLEIAAETMIGFLLDKLVDAVIYYDTDEKMNEVQKKVMALISDNYKAACDGFYLWDDGQLCQVIVSGTERHGINGRSGKEAGRGKGKGCGGAIQPQEGQLAGHRQRRMGKQDLEIEADGKL